MHNFNELKIWQKSMSLAKDIYLVTTEFPSDEKFGLISQIKRCSVSIPSNIAEGTSRQSTKEFKYFLRISLGSSFELETQLLLAKELNYISNNEFDEINPKVKELHKMIVGFENSLTNSKSNNLMSNNLKSN